MYPDPASTFFTEGMNWPTHVLLALWLFDCHRLAFILGCKWVCWPAVSAAESVMQKLIEVRGEENSESKMPIEESFATE